MQYRSATAGGSFESVSSVTTPDQWSQLERFLILGNENGIYYAGGRKLTPESAGSVRACLAENGVRVVNAISVIAAGGRAPKLDAALFALAMASSPRFADAGTNAAALEALPAVARTAAHLQKFAASVTRLRGWGRSLRSAIAGWYLQKPPRELAQQMLKKRERGRWSHADLLRLSHPKPANKAQRLLFRWAVEGELGRVPDDLLTADLKQIYAFEQAKKARDRSEVVRLIEDYQLTHEMLPAQWANSAEVWEALLETMPYCAMLRHLAKLTAVGLIAEQGAATALLAARLVDRRRIARAKANPVTLLSALLQYRQNGGVSAIAAALEEAYYLSFENIQPCGRRICLMTDGAAPLASASMAMLAARTESHAVTLPEISKKDRLDAVFARQAVPPLLDAGADADAIVIVTGDAGSLPSLERYRGASRIVTIAANADPNADVAPLAEPSDPRMLHVVGFDATVPSVVADFIRAC